LLYIQLKEGSMMIKAIYIYWP